MRRVSEEESKSHGGHQIMRKSKRSVKKKKMGGASKRTIKEEEELASGVQSGIDAYQGKMGKYSHYSTPKLTIEAKHEAIQRSFDLMNSQNLGYAKEALEFYEKRKRQDSEFKILEVLNSKHSILVHRESKTIQVCRHVSFIAGPKNADCSDVSPKYFFAEFLGNSETWTLKGSFCSTFEPSDHSGFNHGCTMCPPILKFHPPDGYCVGRPPWLYRNPTGSNQSIGHTD